MHNADYAFVLQNLVLKDFKIRYRSMSLGMFWSVLNPLVMMGVLSFVFTKIFPNPVPAFPVFLLCGLVPFNFVTVAWSGGMVSIADSAGLVKRVAVPRVLLPVANVLANCVHMLIQIALLLGFALAYGFEVNRYWLLMPLLWFFEVVFVLGLVMLTTALDVYVRDMRNLVDSLIRVLFWFVPIFYGIENIPVAYRSGYELNPVAALTLALRIILIDGSAPPAILFLKLSTVAVAMLIAGWFVFARLERRFYEQL